jgi:CheY-like chemotaxis protein
MIDMRGNRILIVDDEAPLRFLLSKQLNRAGAETTTAADGEAALLAAAGAPFDAIVLDVVMPKMDGFEVCRRLKADPRTAEVPVIFLSASCSGEFRRRAFRVGAADFLAKPFEMELLPTYIQAVLRRREEPAPRAGHVISVIGADRGAGAADMAVRLAQTAALQGPGPAMLIDLELPAGGIGARLQLSGGPNVRVLLQDTGEPVSMAAIGRVAQRYHGALEVMPAPFSPPAVYQDDPSPQRLADVLGVLKASGYYVVVHLGTQLDALTLTAMSCSETIWTAAGEPEAREALLARITAAGIAREQILPPEEEPAESLSPVTTTAPRTHAPKHGRARQRAGGRLATA